MNKTKQSHWTNVIVFAVSALLVAASAGLGIVWMRQQITHTAYHAKTLEQQMAQVERKHSYLLSKIAEVHSPDFLKQRMQGTLVAPAKDQIVWAQLPKKNTGSSKVYGSDENLSLNLELALLAMTQTP
ncbi:MAG: hypothetical protein Tsb0018_05880 [Opitutales bacterium]|tara:strand:- start:916 stop:1299 length:384 start_codon:yes stop_codon:yes gene_type:complete